MYLPRNQISTLYTSLLRTTHPLSPPVLILTALTVDALCATRILASLLRRDYIPHKIQPVSGYADLQDAGAQLVLPVTRQKGGEGGVVVCLGLGGGVDLEEVLGLDGRGEEDMREHGVEVWVVDARRPWNLPNVFATGAPGAAGGGDGREGVEHGRLLPSYRPGKGGIVVWDDGDIDAELAKEREAFMELQKMPEIDEEDLALENGAVDSDAEDEDEGRDPSSGQSRKRKASSQDSDSEDDDGDGRPRQRRRSNSSTPIPSSPGGRPRSAQIPMDSTPPPSSQPRSPGAVIPSSPPLRKPPSQRQLKKQLLKLRRKHEATLEAYYTLGTSYSEPASSMLYSLASELGREDNDLLWLAIVGISSVELSAFSTSFHNTTASGSKSGGSIMSRSEQVRSVLRDEVRRLNPVSDADIRRGQNESIIPTHARSPTDTAIRLSPEPRFLLIRHWSLYDSMLYSPFLSTRLHVWSEAGRKRLNKLLAKMGVSLQEAGKGYVHMDMELKRSLRERLLKFAEMYNLEGLVPGEDGRGGREGWGFVRSWGWKATLSAVDVAVVVEAILEVGPDFASGGGGGGSGWDGNARSTSSYNSRVRALPTPPHSEDGSSQQVDAPPASDVPDWTTHRFFRAYDALAPSTQHSSTGQGLSVLLDNIPTAQHLARTILRTGSALVAKKQIRHLRSFRMGVVKEGPDVPLFTHPGALTKLAGWVAEAIEVLEIETGGRKSAKGLAADRALVLAALDEGRGVYVVVGLGGGGGAGAGRRRVKSKQEIKEKEDKRKRREATRAAKRSERARKREERRRLRREILDANGIGSDEEDDESDATESDASSSSGSSSSDSENEDAGGREGKKGMSLNRFGRAFQLVVAETGARVRIDSFEHSVVEVRKEDLAGFLEALSLRSLVG